MPFFKFCQVVQSNSYSAKTATNVLFEFYRFALPVFSFVFNLFFLLYFHAVFPALYNNWCTKTTLNVVTLVSHAQKTGDKKSVHCGVIMHDQ